MRIEVGKQHPLTLVGKRSSEIHCCSRLTYATLLISDRNDECVCFIVHEVQ